MVVSTQILFICISDIRHAAWLRNTNQEKSVSYTPASLLP